MITKCPDELLTPWLKALERDENDLRYDLERFLELLVKWQKVQNLVSRETLSEFWNRHIVDSLQVASHVTASDVNIVDIGSGGGLPAIPLAIAFSGSDKKFNLVESNGRKVSFLRTCSREIGLSLSVHNARIEAVDSRETGQADLMTARALAPLPLLFTYSMPYLSPKGHMLFHKGREYVEEIAEARISWDFDVLINESASDQNGVILDISNLRPKSADSK